MGGPILQASAISKSFEVDRQPLPAVAQMDLTVNAGEFLCLVGPSGCGKSTLRQLFSGLMPPDSGQVYFEGQPLTQPAPEIGIVFQKPNLMPWRTVIENILLPLQIQGIPMPEARRQAQKTLELVGLADFIDVYPKQLSGGMEQRIALARALVQRPRLLLLDEPFGALDALTRERLNLEILELWRKKNLTAIMVTHNIREAVFLAVPVLVLSQRPATPAAEFVIPLPRPRPKGIEYTETFGSLAYAIRQAIPA
jgi:NitT/TauT family transport system ATP-binding protein